MDKPFYLKQFALHQGNTAQRVGTDALLLGAWPFVHTLPEKAHILDVGAGTGIVSLMMAQRFSGAMVDAWEVEDGALKDAATNFAASPFADRLRIHSQDYLYAKREQWHPFDLIISNPPYYTEGILPDDARLRLARHVAEGLSPENLHLVSWLRSTRSQERSSVRLRFGVASPILRNTHRPTVLISRFKMLREHPQPNIKPGLGTSSSDSPHPFIEYPW